MANQRDPQSDAPPNPPAPSAFTVGLPQAGDALPPSLLAHSGFIKRASCVRCGAPKTLPSKTAYLYCDYCGALVDYDFRLANLGANAGITNTVYERIEAPCRPDMDRAKAAGDYPAYRAIMQYVFATWIEECPQAVSPRARTDLDFRRKLVDYYAETAVVKNMDVFQQQLEAQMQALIASTPRIPSPGGAWMFGGDIGPLAALWKQQMDLAYAHIQEYGVAAMDPDDPPPGVALKMEYSAFCQAWLPHLPPAEGERIIGYFGLAGDYVQVEPQTLQDHRCGGCGAELHTVVGARVVVCEDCGQQIDIANGAFPCKQCGAPLNFPASATRLSCPYCRAETQRV